MFRQVIVPVDGTAWSQRVVLPACRIARACHATVSIVSVAVHGEHQEDLSRSAEELAAGLEYPDVLVTVERAPDAAEAIAAEAATAPGSLVCMTSIGRSHLGRVFGSVAEGVLERVRGPVLIFGPEADEASFRLQGPLLVAVDGSTASEAILSVAGDWCAAFGMAPRVVTVLRPGGVPEDLQGDLGPETSYVQLVAHRLQRHVDATVDFDVLHGTDVARELIEDAADHQVRVIAAATHGRTGLARVVAGSVTASLVHRAPLPVLALRPAGLEGEAG